MSQNQGIDLSPVTVTTVNPMDPATLVDKTFGPNSFHVSPDVVREFVAITGDSQYRWSRAAPPGFMAAALFVVAPELLGQLEGQSVIHGEQSFIWLRPMEIGAELTVTGAVTRVRERGGVYFTTFEIVVSDFGEIVATGTSLFLISDHVEPGKTSLERVEPGVAERGDSGEDRVAASRADLVRYAAATRDWNPIHWDHDSAIAAGLPGIVAHGLLQAAWALRKATTPTVGDAPLANARVRFRSPLFPGQTAEIFSEWTDYDVSVSLIGGNETFLTAKVEFADE
jgi:acyl dehydratase